VEDKNLNRILNSTASDAADGADKSAVQKRAIDAMKLGTCVEAFNRDLLDREMVDRPVTCCSDAWTPSTAATCSTSSSPRMSLRSSTSAFGSTPRRRWSRWHRQRLVRDPHRVAGRLEPSEVGAPTARKTSTQPS
jgi:hypothetical protein